MKKTWLSNLLATLLFVDAALNILSGVNILNSLLIVPYVVAGFGVYKTKNWGFILAAVMVSISLAISVIGSIILNTTNYFISLEFPILVAILILLIYFFMKKRNQ